LSLQPIPPWGKGLKPLIEHSFKQDWLTSIKGELRSYLQIAKNSSKIVYECELQASESTRKGLFCKTKMLQPVDVVNHKISRFIESLGIPARKWLCLVAETNDPKGRSQLAEKSLTCW
jgi:hypothetical protein